jgi:hypothetical protein
MDTTSVKWEHKGCSVPAHFDVPHEHGLLYARRLCVSGFDGVGGR